MDGWKTYLCAAGGVIVLGLRAAGQSGMIPQLALIPEAVWEFALYMLGFGGIAALRAAVTKVTTAPFESSREPELPRSEQ